MCAMLILFGHSVCFLLSSVFILLAFNVLGSVDADPFVPSHFVMQIHPEYASSHRNFFMLLAAALGLAAYTGVLDIRRLLPRIIFSALFTFSMAVVLKSWAFAEVSMGAAPDSANSFFGMPLYYCVALLWMVTSTIFHTLSSSSAVALCWSSLTMWTLLPTTVSLWIYFVGSGSAEAIAGVLWAAAVTAPAMAAVLRFSIWQRELASTARTKSASEPIRQRKLAITIWMAGLCAVGFTFFATHFSQHISRDLAVPVSAMVFLCLPRSAVTGPPAVTSVLIAASWWTLSALYSLLLKGITMTASSRGSAQAAAEMSGFRVKVWLAEDAEDSSVWTAPALWVPLLNLLMLCIPVVAVYWSAAGFFSRRSSDEDMKFMMTVLSLVPLIGSNLWAIHLLSVTAFAFGFWASYMRSTAAAESRSFI